MKTEPKSRIAIATDLVTGAPFAAEVNDSTAWPSERATHEAMRTLLEIHNRGYEGLRLAARTLGQNEILLNRNVDLASPEGHLVDFVMGLAEHGHTLSTKLALGLLQHMYQSAGLQSPTPRPVKDQIFISGMEG